MGNNEAKGAPVIDAIVNRRSIRRFLPNPVPLQTVTSILSGLVTFRISRLDSGVWGLLLSSA